MCVILVHQRECFTADTATTLEIHLILPKEYGAAREGALFERPLPLVHWTCQNVLVEVIDRLVDIERVVRVVQECYEVSL